jgi:alpha-glucosidase (family GH31 glycosyl hydrolase)
VLGSDIGGYLDRDDQNLTGPVIPFDSVNFARWTATAGLMPFFQLHGRANITPWTVPDRATEVVAVYRYWSKLHHELVPFFFSLARTPAPPPAARRHPRAPRRGRARGRTPRRARDA